MLTVSLSNRLINLEHVVSVTMIKDLSDPTKIVTQVDTKVDRFNLTLQEGCIISIAMEHKLNYSYGKFYTMDRDYCIANRNAQVHVENLINHFTYNQGAT